MAGTTDPRAQGFNASQFRDAIRFAMNMGLPNASEERVTFRWKIGYDFEIADPAGNPYDFSVTPEKVYEKADIQVPAAVEFIHHNPDGTSVGQMDQARAVLTLLDEDFAEVDGADWVIIGGNQYNVDYVAPPMGLFDVTVYQIYLTAQDES